MTRYVMEIDLGECESEEEAQVVAGDIAVWAGNALLDHRATYTVRPALPVLRTCGDCAHYVDRRDGECGHPDGESRESFRNDAPPSWCPKSEESP